MKNKPQIYFILRRSLWKGKVTRSDLMKAFEYADLKTATASRIMDEALVRYSSILQRKPKWIEPVPHPQIPASIWPQVSAGCMLQLLESVPDRFDITGLLPEDLYVIQTSLRHDISRDADMESIIDLILRATISCAIIDIQYVGLKMGENARWRSVAPVSLRHFNGQWRIAAHDLEADDYPLKFFVLPRILDAKVSFTKTPKTLRRQTGDVVMRRYEVKLNPRMTQDQKTVIMRELGVDKNDIITLADDAVFDFKKQWMDNDLTREKPDIVWPLVAELKRI